MLTSIKSMLGVDESFAGFDISILSFINSALFTLSQLGFSDATEFIATSETTWSDLFGESVNLEIIKAYIFFKTKLAFDPPTVSFLLSAIERQIQEYEDRILLMLELDSSD